MSALPKEEIADIYEEEDESVEEDWQEEEDQQADALAEAVGRMERRGQDLSDALLELRTACEKACERRLEAWKGKIDMAGVERAICAEMAAAATLGDLEHVQRLQSSLGEIAQLEADWECARQIEYQLRFGSPEDL